MLTLLFLCNFSNLDFDQMKEDSMPCVSEDFQVQIRRCVKGDFLSLNFSQLVVIGSPR